VTFVAVITGRRMPPHRSLEERLVELENFRNEAKPIIDAYKAGQVIVKLVWVLGGFIVGAAAVMKSWTWITSHMK
jgi:hypothetical protein